MTFPFIRSRCSSSVRAGWISSAVIDGSVAVDHLLHGEWRDASLSGSAMVPVVGWGSFAAKYGDNVARRIAQVENGTPKTAVRIGPTSEVTGKGCVYTCTIDGTERYIGITEDIRRRAREHMRKRGISIETIPGLQTLSRYDQVAVEQTLFDYYGLGRDSGQLWYNKINSISRITRKTEYEESLIRGTEILRKMEYPGF